MTRSRLARAVRGLLRVGPRGWLLLLRAQFALLRWELRKRTRSRGELVRRSARSPSDQDSGPIAREVPEEMRARARDLSDAIDRAARWGPVRSRCLVRSLALRQLLEAEGVHAVEIRFGVRMNQGEFMAHAWVELDGRVLGDDPAHVALFRTVPDLEVVEVPW